ncbi:sensor histidine kinase [Bacillus cereus]|nr:sensor histidine kinase [Bacillus cereus]
MENEKLDKIGKVFYTTKQNGTGLRLVITYKVIEEYQGSVVIQSSVEIGTKVGIFLMIV